MNEMFPLGKVLIIIGLILAGVGFLFLLGEKIPWIGRLPGDFIFKGKNFTFYFPLATSILISLILSVIFYFFFRGK
jgi:hypothetical protein